MSGEAGRNPRVHVSKSGVHYVRPSELVRSPAGRMQIEKASRHTAAMREAGTGSAAQTTRSR